MKTKWIEIFIVVVLLSLISPCFAAWDNDKPADSDAWNTAAASIRANWDALEAIFGTDLATVSTGGTIDVYNVKHPTYGALGDASNDDTVEIQAAIDAAEAASGGVVYFPQGTYMVSNLVVNESYVHLVGCGMRAVYIKAITGTTGSIITIGGSAFVDHTAYNSVRDLTIWGNSTSTKGLTVNHATIFRVDRFGITGCLDDALYLDEVWDSVFMQLKCVSSGASGKAAIHIYNGNEDNCNNLRFYAPHLEANTGYDIWIDASNASGNQNTNINFHGMKLERTSGSGETLVYISGSKGNEKINFSYCLFIGYDADDAIHCDAGASTQVRIMGCNFWNRSNRGTAILLETGRNEVSSNYFYQWDYDIDYQNLTYPADLFMSHNRRTAEATGRIAIIGQSTVWSWSKQFKLYEITAFGATDTSPSVAQGNVFTTDGTAQTLVDLDDGIIGEIVTIISTDATVYDTTSTNLTGSSVDITTADGDVTQWLCENGTVWILLSFVDVSADNS